jgi:hypothetical protein
MGEAERKFVAKKRMLVLFSMVMFFICFDFNFDKIAASSLPRVYRILFREYLLVASYIHLLTIIVFFCKGKVYAGFCPYTT